MSKGAGKSDVNDFYRAGVRGAGCTGTFSDPAGEILSVGREGLADVFDLLHLHSEVPVRGNQPRAVLNPLMVLLAHSTWERLMKAIWSAENTRRGESPARTAPTDAYRLIRTSKDGITASRGALLLDDLTSGVLPQGYRIQDFTRSSGRRLQSPELLSGVDYSSTAGEPSPRYDRLGRRLGGYIRLRNDVAHRTTGESTDVAGVRSDSLDGASVNTSVARTVVAFYVQLIDQTITELLASPFAAGLSNLDRERIALPDHWLSDEGGGTASRRFEAKQLWGRSIKRLPDDS